MAKKRKAGDGLIRQRADGRWEGRYVVGYDDHGYPKTKAVFGKSKRECAEKLAALKTQLGGIPSDKLRPEMRFADWLDHWYETHCKPNIRTSTQSGYEDRIRLHIKPELGEIPLNRLTQNDLQQFYARLKTLLEEAGLPSIRFHDLRHTFATHALTSGVDAKTLAGILGHTNASFTLDTYTHVTPDMREAAGGIVGGFMEDLFGKELKPWQRSEKQATD